MLPQDIEATLRSGAPDRSREPALYRLHACDQSCADGPEAHKKNAQFAVRRSDFDAFFDHMKSNSALVQPRLTEPNLYAAKP